MCMGELAVTGLLQEGLHRLAMIAPSEVQIWSGIKLACRVSHTCLPSYVVSSALFLC